MHQIFCWKKYVGFGQVLAILLVYFASAQLNRLIIQKDTHSVPVWAPSAIGLAAALRFGRIQAACGIFIGSFMHLVVMFYTSARYHHIRFLEIAPVVAFINGMEATISCTLVCLLTRRTKNRFDRRNSALAFFAAIPVAPLIAGYNIAVLMVAIRIRNATQIGLYGAALFSGRLGATCAIVPALSQQWMGLNKRSISLMGAVYPAIVVVYSFVFLNGWGLIDSEQLRPLVFPAFGLLLLMASTIKDIRGVSAAIFMAMSLVMVGSSCGKGPFSGKSHSPFFWLVLEQSFICVVSSASICIAALVREQDATNAVVVTLNSQLQTHLQYRTRESASAMDREEDTGHRKLSFIRRIKEEVRAPLAAMATPEEKNSPSDRKTIEILVSRLDDLIEVGVAETGRMAIEEYEFDPVNNLRLALIQARPDLVDCTTWNTTIDVPKNVHGDAVKLRRCLMETITDSCYRAGEVTRLQLTIRVIRFDCSSLSPYHSRRQIQLRFEVDAASSIEDANWKTIVPDEDALMNDRPLALCEELGGSLYRTADGRKARLDMTFRLNLSARTTTMNSQGLTAISEEPASR
jgi:hypothetical protein